MLQYDRRLKRLKRLTQFAKDYNLNIKQCYCIE